MNLGIGDAVELSRRMVEGGLGDYSQVRHVEAANAARVTERGRKMVLGVHPARRFAFRAIVSAVNVLPPVRKRLGRFIVEF